MNVEFYRHNLGPEEKAKLMECLDGIFLTTGAYVKDFETQFARYLECKHAVGVTSCTAALHLTLLALGIGPGDEVITSPMTFIATANAILYVGATPVFADVDAQTGLMEPQGIEAVISARTKAVIPVHLYGQMCDMRGLRRLADKHGFKIIEDCAHSLESERDGTRPGQLSDAACFSFYATKNMTCGEGGAVATNHQDVADACLRLRQHGMSKNAADRYSGSYQHWDMTELGWKYNMSNIQAALLLPQIPKIEQRWQERKELYDLYIRRISSVKGLSVPSQLPGIKNAYHLFTVLVSSSLRDPLLTHLHHAGIGCAVNYRAIHLLEFYRHRFGYGTGSFPIAEKMGEETVSLPFWIGMGPQQVDYIVKTIKDFLNPALS